MKPLLIASVMLYAAGLIAVFIYHVKKAASLELASKAALCAGLLSHSAALAARVYSTGHAPMASMYETLLFFSWCTALLSVFVIFRYGERATELVTIPVAVLALLFSFANEKPGGPLTLILRTRWFETHVTFSFVAYAFFTLAFSAALLYLVYGAWLPNNAEQKKFEDIAAKAVMWGFGFFSASMFSGAVWGYLAWGAYWMWEPKIIWSFIVWFYYAGAMHAYYVRQWRGKGLAFATLFGFFVVLFTYLGVSMLMKSSHSF
ncbi:MAG: cytochrome c biogenesis protein CcsA [Deltaproteobacteria bacterium]|nr:cytochrome c biogenesis protein CcsA [Deltaproteobacteria bacterium]